MTSIPHTFVPGPRLPAIPSFQGSLLKLYREQAQKMSNDSELPGEFDDESYEITPAPEEVGPLQSLNPKPPPDTQWKASSRTVEETLARGLSNEDLWMLIRRFNKVSLVLRIENNR